MIADNSGLGNSVVRGNSPYDDLKNTPLNWDVQVRCLNDFNN
jgi:hypothetical protein